MTIAAVLLAAGLSRRFGAENKIQASLDGIPLGHHAARTLRDVAVDARYVVSSPGARDWPGFVVVPNDRPETGLSRSIALGVAAARTGGARAVLIALADMPFVPVAHFARLLARYGGPESLVASVDNGRRTPPALFGANWFAALESLSGDRGAASLLALAETVAAHASTLTDIDSTDDLDRARGRSGIGSRPSNEPE